MERLTTATRHWTCPACNQPNTHPASTPAEPCSRCGLRHPSEGDAHLSMISVETIAATTIGVGLGAFGLIEVGGDAGRATAALGGAVVVLAIVTWWIRVSRLVRGY